MTGFADLFALVTGRPEPFPWQAALYERLRARDIPAALDIPTGLGKTSVIAIWLIARALGAPVPRRLVYVVDRRAVVDQASAEAEAIAGRIGGDGEPSAVGDDVRADLGLSRGEALRIATLRGQFAANRLWFTDPGAAAIVVGTVDMIGSRLLFGGYGVSRKMRPVHAGLLACDTLVVLDEAHLCAPFLALLDEAGATAAAAAVPVPTLRVMALTATGRGRPGPSAPLSLADADFAHPMVRARLDAQKPLRIDDGGDGALHEGLARHAWEARQAPDGTARRVLVYCDSRKAAQQVRDLLVKQERKDGRVRLLTGQRRVLERERLVREDVYRWFLEGTPPDGEPAPAFLVATSAGEVGVDLDADALVCDLVAFERMVQRLGRVNRRGGVAPAPVVVVAPPPAKAKPEDAARRRAVEALPVLPDGALDASVGAVHALKARAAADPALDAILDAATTSDPLRPALTLPLVEAWSMTALDAHTGRPEVEPWLRGWIEEDEPDVEVVWRRLLPWRADDKEDDDKEPVPDEINRFFERAPIHRSEVLEAPVSTVLDVLKKRVEAMSKAGAMAPSNGLATAVILLLDQKNEFVAAWTSEAFGKELEKTRTRDILARKLTGKRLVLQADLGGLDADGLLDARADGPKRTLDDEPEPVCGWTEAEIAAIGWRVRRIEGDALLEDGWARTFALPLGSGDEQDPAQLVVENRLAAEPPGVERGTGRTPETIAEHHGRVEAAAHRLADRLNLSAELRAVLAAAARLHDHGKRRPLWQDAMGAPKDGRPFAKTAGKGGNPALLAGYRHEFGSLVAALRDPRLAPELAGLSDDLRDLALHLVAAHHGLARPVMPPILPPAPGAPDDLPPSAAETIAREAALRFARLPTIWGPWGLAWWEAVFRAADWHASAPDAASGKPGDGR